MATMSGNAMVVKEEGYNGVYGVELVINHGDNLVSRYAHMIPGSIDVAMYQAVRQGQVIGRIGNTGLVADLACGAHPGTHLHFVMNLRDDDGTLHPYDPEPISGHTNILEGRWYVSDNAEYQPATMVASTTNPLSVMASAMSSTVGAVLGAYDAIANDIVVVSTLPLPSSSPSVFLNQPDAPIFSKMSGGVSVMPSPPVSSTPSPLPQAPVPASASAPVPAPPPVVSVQCLLHR